MGAEARSGKGQMRVAPSEGVRAVRRLGDGVDGRGGVRIVGSRIGPPLRERASVAVVADEGAAEAVSRDVPFAAMQDMSTEEDDVPSLSRHQQLGIAVGDPSEVVLSVVGIARPAYHLDVPQHAVAEPIPLLGRIDRLVLAACCWCLSYRTLTVVVASTPLCSTVALLTACRRSATSRAS